MALSSRGWCTACHQTVAIASQLQPKLCKGWLLWPMLPLVRRCCFACITKLDALVLSTGVRVLGSCLSCSQPVTASRGVHCLHLCANSPQCAGCLCLAFVTTTMPRSRVRKLLDCTFYRVYGLDPLTPVLWWPLLLAAAALIEVVGEGVILNMCLHTTGQDAILGLGVCQHHLHKCAST